jgi:Fe-S oxidoreductase
MTSWGSAAAPISNWLLRNALGRAIGEAAFGIDRRRRLPRFARRPLASLARRADDDCRAVLFNDTFTNFYEPAIGLAALEVFQAAGVRAGLASNHCCGRPQISKGLLDAARLTIQRNTEMLFPYANAGRAIVFCEPSCLSAVREDAPDLLRGQARLRAQTIAKQSMLFEEYLETLVPALPLKSGPPTILLHGHCHQKSMGLVAPARSLLSKIPGTTVVDVDAGCCGMAGSFGYTRDHYEVSRAIGERRLFPAVRNRTEGTVVVAAGTSCRHQVADFTGVQSVHPAVLLRSLL